MIPAGLLFLYLVEFSILAVHPYDRGVWIAENAPIVFIVAFLTITYRRFQFSNLAYVLMSALLFLHTIGGHYSFERVPFDYVTNFIGAKRNHFDRVAHFTVGFYAFAIAEFVERRQLSRSHWLTGLFAVFTICTVALGYEVFEWRYAIHADPAAGIAVLGSQGDPWDAQKDMLADTLGAISATLLYFYATESKLMALVVFMRGVNVGGHKTFRPTVLAKELAHLGVANIGAAGTLVVREKISPPSLRIELLKKLPFKPALIICPAREVLALMQSDPFCDAPAETKDLRHYVTVLPKPLRTRIHLPFEQPAGRKWEVKIIEITGRFVLSLWQRRSNGIVYPNAVVEKQFTVPATTRNWNTIATIGDILKN